MKQSYLFITTILQLLLHYLHLPPERIYSIHLIPSICHRNQPNCFHFHLKTFPTICYLPKLSHKSISLFLFLLLLYLHLLPTNPIAFHYMLITQQLPISYLLYHSNSFNIQLLLTTQRLPTFLNSPDRVRFIRLDRDYDTPFHHLLVSTHADTLMLSIFTDWITFFIQNVRRRISLLTI